MFRPLYSCLLAALLMLPLAPSDADAQRFSELAAEATELNGSPFRLAARLLRPCRGNAAQRRRCLARRRTEAQRLSNTNYLWARNAPGGVRIDPYESMAGGFRINVKGILLRDPSGVLATRPVESGRMPEHVLAQGFVPVPEAAAERWLAQNSTERLETRIIFRFGEHFSDGELEGVKLDIIAVQVFNMSTGSLLVDSTRGAELPPAPYPLTQRVPLWDNNGQAEAIWAAPDGRRVIFGVRVEPVVDPPNSSAPVVMVHRGADSQDVVRFIGTCCSANVSVTPRHQTEVMIIITERATTEEAPGAGQVLVARWDAARGEFRIVARWRGTNEQRPPAWVLDPSAPLPEE